MQISTYSRHLVEFTKDAHSCVLQREGEPRRYFYRFTNPMMQPYVILKGLADRLITETQLKELRPPENFLFEE